jgi:hypothetical protein
VSLGLAHDIAQAAEELLAELDALAAGCEAMRAELRRPEGFLPGVLAEQWAALRFGPRLGCAAALARLRCYCASERMVQAVDAPLPRPAHEAAPVPAEPVLHSRDHRWQDGDLYGSRAGSLPLFVYQHPQRSPRGKDAASGALAEA